MNEKEFQIIDDVLQKCNFDKIIDLDTYQSIRVRLFEALTNKDGTWIGGEE